MAFQIKDTKKDDKKHIFYNYYDTFSKNISNRKNIKYSFPGKSNSPNIVFLNGQYQTTYISSNLHIFSKTHDINEIDFDAELMIEHTPITNGGKNFIFSFPLKTDPRPESTPIDIIIHSKFGESMDIDLNDYLRAEDNHCIFYETEKYYVCISTIPILVHSTFPKLSSHPELQNSSIYTIIRAVRNNAYKESYKESMVEGMGVFDKFGQSTSDPSSTPDPSSCSTAPPVQPYYLQCSNVPLDDATDVASIVLPANSTVPLDLGVNLTSSKNTSEASYRVMTNSIIYFIGFISIMCISYFIVPVTYKSLLKMFKINGTYNNNSGNLDIVLFFFSFCIITILLTIGMNLDIVYVTYAGLILLIFTIISIFTIQIVVKMDKSYTYDVNSNNISEPKISTYAIEFTLLKNLFTNIF
jgi:hypothetical protein